MGDFGSGNPYLGGGTPQMDEKRRSPTWIWCLGHFWGFEGLRGKILKKCRFWGVKKWIFPEKSQKIPKSAKKPQKSQNFGQIDVFSPNLGNFGDFCWFSAIFVIFFFYLKGENLGVLPEELKIPCHISVYTPLTRGNICWFIIQKGFIYAWAWLTNLCQLSWLKTNL